MKQSTNKKILSGLSALLMLIWMGPSIAAGCSANLNLVSGFQPGDKAWNKYCTKVAGTKRKFKLYVPPGYQAGNPTTLTFALHGGGSFDSMNSFIGYSDLDLSAAANNTIIVYLEAYKKQWNDGRTEAIISDLADQRQDVLFFNQVLDLLKTKVTVDKVLVMGMSNGGMMTLRLACEAADRIDGVAVVSAFMHYEQDSLVCSSASPLPIVFIHGSNDPIISQGDHTIIGFKWAGDQRGYTAGEQRTLNFWRGINGCYADTPSVGPRFDQDKQFGGNKKSTLHQYSCSEAPMKYYDVKKGKHSWFGGVVDVAYEFLK